MSDEQSKVGQELWGGRFSEPTDRFVQRFTASEAFDRALASYDIAGSRAHASMLETVGVLTAAENTAIQEGLTRVLAEIEAGAFQWSVEREDVHMNIEARLTELIGDVGKKLHTGTLPQ
jgi:argininosuccinate lyase